VSCARPDLWEPRVSNHPGSPGHFFLPKISGESEPMESANILAAFLGGVGAMLLRLPPLVGFLGAGFACRFPGKIAAVVEYPEEIPLLRERGADAVFHVYEEAGLGLADSAAEVAGLAVKV
jgi:hypothetical protein